MATYKFDDLNNGLEITNPTIVIHGQVIVEEHLVIQQLKIQHGLHQLDLLEQLHLL